MKVYLRVVSGGISKLLVLISGGISKFRWFCFIESWFMVLSKGWLEGLSTLAQNFTYGGWLAGLLACLLACCLARLLSCLLASLPGLLACLLAGLLACLLGLPACLPGLVACLLACLPLACWLHCERMIGEEKKRGRGKKKTRKIVRLSLKDGISSDCREEASANGI